MEAQTLVIQFPKILNRNLKSELSYKAHVSSHTISDFIKINMDIVQLLPTKKCNLLIPDKVLHNLS